MRARRVGTTYVAIAVSSVMGFVEILSTEVNIALLQKSSI